MKNFIRRNHAPILLIIFGLFLVFGLSHFFEAFKLGIGPEFILKAFGKIFYLGVAFGASHYIIRKFFPTIDAFCSRPSIKDSVSEFALVFKDHPRDPRIWHCIFAHAAVFIGVCLLLALAF